MSGWYVGALTGKREIAGLELASLQAGVEFVSVDADRKAQRLELAVPNQAIDGAGGQAEVPTGRLDIEPVTVLPHSLCKIASARRGFPSAGHCKRLKSISVREFSV